MRWLVALLPLATACADDSVVEVGIIEYYGESDGVLDAPATARAGEVHGRLVAGPGRDDLVEQTHIIAVN